MGLEEEEEGMLYVFEVLCLASNMNIHPDFHDMIERGNQSEKGWIGQVGDKVRK